MSSNSRDQAMQNTQMLQEFMELVQIPVNSKQERQICDVLKKKFSDLGFSVTEDGTAGKVGGTSGNLIAVLKGDPNLPAVLFSAHMDRVGNPGNITPIVHEDTGLITSDGTTILAADDISGVCSILDGIRRIQTDNTPHGDIEVVISVCEEIGVRGGRYLDCSGLKSKQAYVLDCPGRIGRIVKQAPTKCKIVATVKGIMAHAGNEPEKGLNAIKVAACALSEMPEGRISPEVTSNFGQIQGGTGTNVVCDQCVITGEARGTDDAQLNDYLEVVKSTFAKTAERFNTTIDVKIDLLYHTFNVPLDAPVIQVALQAMKAEGIEGICQKGGGGSDANHLNWKGIPTVVLGLGYSKNHTNAEQIYYEDMFACGKLVQRIVQEVAKI